MAKPAPTKRRPAARIVEAEQFALPHTESASEEPLQYSSDCPEFEGENENALALALSPYQQMGDQLTYAYFDAVTGMRRVVKFGAMLMQIRDELENQSTRGQVSGGRGNKGGLEEWLRQYAPKVPHATAYRFLAVAEAVKETCKLPAAALKELGFAGFVNATPESLPPALQAKQLELWTFVDGTSQRSWLDRLRPTKERGGDRHPRCPHCEKRIQGDENPCRHCGKDTGLTSPNAAEQMAELQAAIREDYIRTFAALKAKEDRWIVLNEGELLAAIDIAEEFAAKARAHLKQPVELRSSAVQQLLTAN